MEDVYLSKPISPRLISQALERLFPSLKVFYYDFSFDPPAQFDEFNSGHIFFNTEQRDEKKEFGFVISVYRTPEENHEERLKASLKTEAFKNRV